MATKSKLPRLPDVLGGVAQYLKDNDRKVTVAYVSAVDGCKFLKSEFQPDARVELHTYYRNKRYILDLDGYNLRITPTDAYRGGYDERPSQSWLINLAEPDALERIVPSIAEDAGFPRNRPSTLVAVYESKNEPKHTVSSTLPL